MIMAGCLLVAVTGAFAGITSTFDTDLEGWTLVDKYGGSAEGSIVWCANGGNPGGYVEFTDEGNDGGFISAPSIYLGDWSPFDGNVTLSYEHEIISEEIVNSRLPYEVRIQGPGGQAQFLGETSPPPSGWQLVEVPIESSAWTILSGDWLGVLADVTSFRIRIEQTNGHVDVSGIDNVDFPISASGAIDIGVNESRFVISGSCPNPFSSETRIIFENSPSRGLTVEVFDLRGRLVAGRMDDGASEGPGSIYLDGCDNRGVNLPAGQYFVRLTSGAASTVCKVVIVR